jgi:hypothetical protein
VLEHRCEQRSRGRGDDGKCKRGFAKPVQPLTTIDAHGFPHYKRDARSLHRRLQPVCGSNAVVGYVLQYSFKGSTMKSIVPNAKPRFSNLPLHANDYHCPSTKLKLGKSANANANPLQCPLRAWTFILLPNATGWSVQSHLFRRTTSTTNGNALKLNTRNKFKSADADLNSRIGVHAAISAETGAWREKTH